MDTLRNTITVGTDRELENGALMFLKRYMLLAEGSTYRSDSALSLLVEDPEMQERAPELVAYLRKEIEVESTEDLFSRFVSWDKFSYITKKLLVNSWDVKTVFSLQAFEYKLYTQ